MRNEKCKMQNAKWERRRAYWNAGWIVVERERMGKRDGDGRLKWRGGKRKIAF
jgi:hypothetical protein